MPSRHDSVATISIPQSTATTTTTKTKTKTKTTATMSSSNAMRPPGVKRNTNADLQPKIEKEKDVGRRRRAAAVAAETKIQESTRKSKRPRKAAEDDDGFVFTRVRNIQQPSPSTSNSPLESVKQHVNKSQPTKKKTFTFDDDTEPLEANNTRIPDVSKEDSQTTVVSLPLTDTPIIRRNQQLRQQAPNGRRSSLGLRGKRASSLGNGLVAAPHADIPVEDFYKHLDSDLPDPHRMKQLLTWCAHRILETQRRSKSNNSATAIAKVIEEELVKDLTEGRISTSWWNRPDDGDDDEDEKLKKPNPQNIANAQKVKEFTVRLERLRAEKKAWANIESDVKPVLPPSSNVDVSLLLPKESSFLSKQASQEDLDLRNKRKEILTAVKDVEYDIDRLRHSSHLMNSLSQAGEKYAEQVLGDAAQVLSRSKDRAKKEAKTEGVPIRDVLQTLTRIDRM
ncbi:Mis12-Mtw1 protein family-domain-containing protein [Lipomyces japonicus]|uniref:Mis12-Mtw1 protein family-domain-containing protein n=1 Tax=Lipomyces japonicus TaxID=56871 RepID=UPI0034CE89F8